MNAIASARRREILRLLSAGERSAGAIHEAMPDVTFGAVSLQLKVLLNAGLVDCRAEGQHRIYSVRQETLGPVAGMLQDMWADALWKLKLAAELEQARRGPRAASRRRRKSPPTRTRSKV